jgi:hypothetical protein
MMFMTTKSERRTFRAHNDQSYVPNAATKDNPFVIDV